MRTLFLLSISGVLFCSLLSACGESPLFNHRREGRHSEEIVVASAQAAQAKAAESKVSKAFNLIEWLGDLPEICPVAFTTLNLCADIYFEQALSYEEPAAERTFLLKVWSSSTKSLQSASDIPRIIFEMPSGCCGIQYADVSPYSDANGTEIVGVYRIQQIYFSHRGLYEVRIRMKLDESQKETNKYVFVLP